jgi:hypothetical protein
MVINDFDFVTSRLATGGAVRTEDMARLLLAAGITHVINAADDVDDDILVNFGPNLKGLYNPTEDRFPRKPKPVEWFEKSLSFALPVLAQPRTKLYVHCADGINRGPSTAYAILRALGLSSGVSESMIRTARPCVALHYMYDADAAVAALGYT